MEAGAAAASCERERGWRFVSRSKWHRLRGRHRRQADNTKDRRNQYSSHEFAFQVAARRALRGFIECRLNDLWLRRLIR
jgi:hypothetical protein